jgi:predicted secreted protein
VRYAVLTFGVVLALAVAGWVGARVQLAILASQEEASQSQASHETPPCTVQPDSVNQVTASVGQELVIGLDANETTPTRWTLSQSPDPSLVRVMDAEYLANPNPQHLAGSGGVDCWTFLPVGAGRTELQFTLINFASLQTIQTRSFEISVGPASG